MASHGPKSAGTGSSLRSNAARTLPFFLRVLHLRAADSPTKTTWRNNGWILDWIRMPRLHNTGRPSSRASTKGRRPIHCLYLRAALALEKRCEARCASSRLTPPTLNPLLVENKKGRNRQKGNKVRHVWQFVKPIAWTSHWRRRRFGLRELSSPRRTLRTLLVPGVLLE